MSIENQKDINLFIKVVLAFSIFKYVYGAFTEIAHVLSPETVDYGIATITLSNHALAICQLVVDVLMIAVLLGVFNKKKWGVFGFYILQILACISICVLGGDIVLSFFQFVFLCVAFSFLLMLKKNGLSAWKTIFSRNSDEDYSKVSERSHDDEKAVSIVSEEKDIAEADSNKGAEVSAKENELILETKNTNETIHEEAISIDEDSNKENFDFKQKETTFSFNKQKDWRLGKAKVLIFTGIGIMLVGFVIGICIYNNTPERKFERAHKLFSEGKIEKAIKVYTELADEENFVKAQTELGRLYLDNDSVPLNAKKGLAYLEKAAAMDSVALYDLFLVYGGYQCKGADLSNYEKLEYYLNFAIKHGNCLKYAYYILGNMKESDDDYSSAYYYWKKSADLGLANAYDKLGLMFWYGLGCEGDGWKAKYYFEQALKLDDKDDFAMFYLGLIYERPTEYALPVDKEKAKEYYRRAAELGNEDAQRNYGNMELNE